ncbi:hypothetical protein TNCV_4386301 [Trichonephila clavipes]|nr:hypothetical protein TNCV_4386301 [Trichonephila clavipes]
MIPFITFDCTRKYGAAKKWSVRPVKPEEESAKSVRFQSLCPEKEKSVVAVSPTRPTFALAFTLTANLPERGINHKIQNIEVFEFILGSQ